MAVENESEAFRRLRDTVNEVWASLYPGAEAVDDLFALEMRIRNIAEDRNCWAFNARVLQKQVNETGRADSDAGRP